MLVSSSVFSKTDLILQKIIFQSPGVMWLGKVLRVSAFHTQAFTQIPFSVCDPCMPSIVTGILQARDPILLS